MATAAIINQTLIIPIATIAARSHQHQHPRGYYRYILSHPTTSTCHHRDCPVIPVVTTNTSVLTKTIPHLPRCILGRII